MVNQEAAQVPLEPDYLLTVEEVQRMLHVSRSTVYLLTRRHELPTVHIGRALRFRPQDVQAYIRNHSIRKRK